MWTSRGTWRSRSPWSNFALNFEELQKSAEYHVCFWVSIKTKALSWVYLDPAHQALVDRFLALQKDGMTCHQIADYLIDDGVSSWTGKRFYPELVFGVLRKAVTEVVRGAGVTSVCMVA